MFKPFFLSALFAASTALSFADHPDDPMTLFHFQSNLRPHGEWIVTDEGISAWRPLRVAGDWRPYMVGRWVWSPRGWYWSSREPWAWATYHYGRWHFDPLYGWVWVPGYEWAPAWVDWRYGDGCVGWAPLGYYANSFALTVRWSTPDFWWSFVDCRYMTSSSVDRFVYRVRENDRYIRRTRVIGNARRENGIVHSGGPRYSDIEHHTGREIERIDLPDRTRPDRLKESEGGRKRDERRREESIRESKHDRAREDSHVVREDRKQDVQATEGRSRGGDQSRSNRNSGSSEREKERRR